MNKKVIVLGPGHGLSRKGTWERPLLRLIENGKAVEIVNKFTKDDRDCDPEWYREDLGILAITWEAKAYLEQMGYEVHLTRADERDVHQWVADELNLSQWKRDHWGESKYVKALCLSVKSDVYVGIHTNASVSPISNGCIGFWTTPSGCDLADEIVESITKDLKIKRRFTGLNKRKFAQFNGHSKGRCCLIECMFHSNPKELKLLLNPEKIRDIGKAIAKGIDSYVKKFVKD